MNITRTHWVLRGALLRLLDALSAKVHSTGLRALSYMD